jgi:hypothetical protein
VDCSVYGDWPLDMIAPLVALKKRARTSRSIYSPPRTKKAKTFKEQRQVDIDAEIQPLLSPHIENTNSGLAKMATVSAIDPEEMLTGDELSSDKEELSSELSEADQHAVLRPRRPFKERVNPFVGPKDESFLEIEHYFFSLLRSPNLTINDIIEANFDDHEVTLITPQSGPPDVVRWQNRNARRYHENLETRFKGHTATLPFKLACLYFGLPVEPLRTETMPSPLPLGQQPLDEDEVAPDVDPLKFLETYEHECELFLCPVLYALLSSHI